MRKRRRLIAEGWLCAFLIGPLAMKAAGESVRWTLTNHAGDYANELVRLKVNLKTPYDASRLVVTEDGREVPCQIELHQGTLTSVKQADLWVCTTIASKATREYSVTTGGHPQKRPPLVKVWREGRSLILDNGLLSVKLPAAVQINPTTASNPPGPITAIRIGEGQWIGAGEWRTALSVAAFSATVVGDGALFGKVRLRYEFSAQNPGKVPPLTLSRHGISTGSGEVPPAPWAEVTVTLAPGQPLISIEESHAMAENDAWIFRASHGWHPRQAFSSRENSVPKARELKPDPSLNDGTSLIFLQPRWTQSTNCGWFFGVADDQSLVGAVAMRAGKWDWPYDNQIIVQAKPEGGAATLVYPTWKGRRFSYLLAGAPGLVSQAPALIKRVAMQPLDKLVHEYTLDWPGLPPGGFQGIFWWDGSAINPSSMIRGLGRRNLEKYRNGSDKPDRALLGQFQIYLDPDCYGYYRNHFSPINPNFSTDLLKVPIAMCAGLKGHPEFHRFRKMAEDALRMDLDHAVTLPGGAGQECPGYLAHAMGGWLELADLCKNQLGFDPREWPRWKAAASFLLHTSQPAGDGRRRILPAGDTHPPGTDVMALADKFGARERVEDFSTEELPGFGVVFRSRSGQPNENFLAFKAGPNRGHYHGDQLSFHYCGEGRRLAIDHMCSYSPRADQEHLHNRVAFFTREWEFANMDGHERLIGYQTSPEADAAMALVASQRLRRQPRTPQEISWNPRGPHLPLSEDLQYTRTLVFVKHPGAPAGGALDYFVIRDQARGPEVGAAYCLHVEADGCQQDGQRFIFGNLTLFCAAPADFKAERFDWGFEKKGRGGGGESGYRESTIGIRLARSPSTTHEFITVLYPSGQPPRMEAIPGGVRVALPGGGTEEIVFRTPRVNDPADAAYVLVKRDGREAVALAGRNVNLLRSQGDVGLFIPECGYDFGPVPEWLIKQRDGRRMPGQVP